MRFIKLCPDFNFKECSKKPPEYSQVQQDPKEEPRLQSPGGPMNLTVSGQA